MAVVQVVVHVLLASYSNFNPFLSPSFSGSKFSANFCLVVTWYAAFLPGLEFSLSLRC